MWMVCGGLQRIRDGEDQGSVGGIDVLGRDRLHRPQQDPRWSRRKPLLGQARARSARAVVSHFVRAVAHSGGDGP